MTHRPQFALATIFYLTTAAALVAAVGRFGAMPGIVCALLVFPLVIWSCCLDHSRWPAGATRRSNVVGEHGLHLTFGLMWLGIVVAVTAVSTYMTVVVLGEIEDQLLLDYSVRFGSPYSAYILVTLFILTGLLAWYWLFWALCGSHERSHGRWILADVVLMASIVAVECLLAYLLMGLLPSVLEAPFDRYGLAHIAMSASLPAIVSVRFTLRWRRGWRPWALAASIGTLASYGTLLYWFGVNSSRAAPQQHLFSLLVLVITTITIGVWLNRRQGAATCAP